MCWGVTSTISQGVYTSIFVFISCLCRASRLARGESLEPSQVFPEHSHSPRHSHNPKHAYYLDSLKYVRVFQSPYGHHIPQIFLLTFIN